MSATAGKNTRVKFSTTAGGAGTYTAAIGCKNVSIEINGQNIDVSEFGTDWTKRIQGLKDAKISISGMYEAGDTTGQAAVRSALISDTELWVQVLHDGSAGFKSQVRVGKMGVDSGVEKEVGVSIDLEGTGAVTVI